MANLRIVYNNALDRVASISASSTAGSLVVDNLRSDVKSEVWRASDTAAQLILTWGTAEPVGCVALPFCSLTSTATIRVRGYTNIADGSPAVDSGVILAAPSSIGYAEDWGLLPLGVNTYSYGGGAYAVAWVTQTMCRKVVIDLVDSANALGYIEASKLVVGPYWSPINNCETDSVRVGAGDTSKQERSDAGDLLTDRGVLYKTLSFSLDVMPAQDRDHIWRIIRGNGLYRPLFVSLLPDAADVLEEQLVQVYGKLTKTSEIQYKIMGMYATTLQLEEI